MFDNDAPAPVKFINKRTGKEQVCRMSKMDFCDPITTMSGCAGEIAESVIKKDIYDGCPDCTERNML